MFVAVCSFKRSKRAEWEPGIAMGNDDSDITTIVDNSGNRVNVVNNYNLIPAKGCFWADLSPTTEKAAAPSGEVTQS